MTADDLELSLSNKSQLTCYFLSWLVLMLLNYAAFSEIFVYGVTSVASSD